MSLIRGVLLAGKFRTHHELNRMSQEDQRNTLIVEMAVIAIRVPHFHRSMMPLWQEPGQFLFSFATPGSVTTRSSKPSVTMINATF